MKISMLLKNFGALRITEKTLSNYEFMQQTMKAVSIGWIMIMGIIFLLTAPSAAAQDGDEEASDDACILTTFCVIILFIFFLIYINSRNRSKNPEYPRGANPPQYPPKQPGNRYTMPQSYPPPTSRNQRLPPPKGEIKCDLCDSKNIRAFEDGYFKCNDCRHVFYHTESSRRRR